MNEFKKHFPKVHLKLHQGSPREIVQMLIEGEADIGFATEILGDIDDFVSFPFCQWHHVVVVPNEHPLIDFKALSLEVLADYPIITYHEGFTGRASIEKTFSSAGIVPDIVISALDADVIKSYVELGLGIGIIASVAFSCERDVNLKVLDGSMLFPANKSKLAIRKGHFLRRYAYRFIEMCSPELTEKAVSHIINENRKKLVF